MPKPANSASGIDIPAMPGISDTAIATTAVVPSIEPTERSMPPVRMIKVMPAANTMLIDACRAIFSRLASVKKFGATKPKTATIRINIGKIPTVCIISPNSARFSVGFFAPGGNGFEVMVGSLSVGMELFMR
ncbi:hypothetical protein D3C72_1684140 [compost metagenome]